MSIKQNTRRGLVLLGACLGIAAMSGNAMAAKKFDAAERGGIRNGEGHVFSALRRLSRCTSEGRNR